MFSGIILFNRRMRSLNNGNIPYKSQFRQNEGTNCVVGYEKNHGKRSLWKKKRKKRKTF